MERGFSKKRRLKFRYSLIVVLIIIIILLIAIINLVKAEKKTEISNEEDKSEVQKVEEAEEKENDVMIFEVEDIKQTEEQKAEEEKENAEATGIVFLTFDDGPSSDSTPQILDILERRNIKATFFVLHYSENNEQYIKREHQQGHTIALHGYTHNYSEVYKSADTCMENFRKIQEQVYQSTGIKSNILRFPGGSSNTISKKYCQGVMTQVTTRAVNEGFRYFDWNVDSDDAGHAKSSNDIYNNVTSGLKPDRNNVVLMHDFSGNHKTIEALDSIIDFGLNNGYVFRKLTDEVPMVTHSVNN